MNRNLIIGLDGATFDIIDPMIESGRLPNIRKLIDGGTRGELKSTIPPASIPAWPSFYTGVNPGKHGCFDFLTRDDDDFYGRPINSSDVKNKSMWKMLSEYGYRSIVINVTSTYPPEEINGIIVSGMLTPPDEICCHPPSLQSKLDEVGYEVFLDLETLNSSDYSTIFNRLCQMENRRIQASLELMKEYDWDLMVIMVIGTDTMQHKLWDDKKAVYDYYEEIDGLIGRLLDNVSKSTNVFIISDHGFEDHHKNVNINLYLESLGYLRKKNIKDPSLSRRNKIGSIRGRDLTRNFNKSFAKLKRLFGEIFELSSPLVKKLPFRLRMILSEIVEPEKRIDWAKSQAFLSSFYGTETQGITINLKGREPFGVVEPEHFEEVREEVMNGLMELTDDETGESVFKEVFKSEEIYNGPYVWEAPDIITLLREGYKFSNSLQSKGIMNPLNRVAGKHAQFGVFIAHGPDIKEGQTIDGINIMDIIPTILYMMDIPIPDYVDGRVVKELFEGQISSDIGSVSKNKKNVIKKRIRDLKTRRSDL